MQPLTPIVKQLLLINIFFFLVQSLLGFNLIESFGIRYIASDYFRPYQIFTYLFIHGNFMHLFNNMLSLFIFGPVIENTLTSRKFIIFYLFIGISTAVLYSVIHYIEISKLEALYHTYLAHPDPESFHTYLNKFPHNTYNTFYHFTHNFFNYPSDPVYIAKSKDIVKQLYQRKVDIPLIGASGVCFGILTAFALLFPHAELFFFFFPIPIKAKYIIGCYGLYELYAGLQHNPADNIAHFAHLGGIVFAYLFIRWWQRQQEPY